MRTSFPYLKAIALEIRFVCFAFSKEEINSVKEAVVVPSQYGNSVCFMLKAGGQVFLPLSNDSNVGVGESVDLTKAKLLTLEKDGEKDIQRVRV